jgi:hypothetical protein
MLNLVLEYQMLYVELLQMSPIKGFKLFACYPDKRNNVTYTYVI